MYYDYSLMCLVAEGKKSFGLYVDGAKVTVEDNPDLACIYYFALYYNLNLAYAKDCCFTMEYMQRYNLYFYFSPKILIRQLYFKQYLYI